MNKILLVKGMTCGHCAMHVEEALRKIPEVDKVIVNQKTGRAEVSLKSDVPEDRFKAAIDESGYVFAGISV